MDCQDLLRQLNAYIDGDLDPAVCEGLEEHLAGCDPCQVVVDNIKGTVRLYKGSEPYPLPERFEKQLKARLRAKWRERFGKD